MKIQIFKITKLKSKINIRFLQYFVIVSYNTICKFCPTVVFVRTQSGLPCTGDLGVVLDLPRPPVGQWYRDNEWVSVDVPGIRPAEPIQLAGKPDGANY